MTRCVALLRGIGPGNPNMRNEHLRRVCEELGLDDVSTVISSGNVVFDTDSGELRDLAALETTLERTWSEKLGFESATIIRTVEDLERLEDLQPFGGLEHGRVTYLLVTFAKSPITFDFDFPHQPDARSFRLVGATDRELFFVTDTTATRTPDVMGWIEGQFGKGVTSRTWLTVGRILKRMSSSLGFLLTYRVGLPGAGGGQAEIRIRSGQCRLQEIISGWQRSWARCPWPPISPPDSRWGTG